VYARYRHLPVQKPTVSYFKPFHAPSGECPHPHQFTWKLPGRFRPISSRSSVNLDHVCFRVSELKSRQAQTAHRGER
jgi:hypothetical protein